MANRRFYQIRLSYERDIVDIYVKVAIGAAGAPTILNAKGVVTVIRNSAGNYTLNLRDNFNVLLDVDSKFISGASAPAAQNVNIVSETVISTTAPALIIQARNSAGVATDPASGEIMIVRITARNAST